MSRYATQSLARLVTEVRRLPGVGIKLAERIALHILEGSESRAQSLAEAILAVKEKVVLCGECFNYSEDSLCSICRDEGRNREQICVVEQARDVHLFEAAGGYQGLYHVLHGVLAPLDGVGPDQLRLDHLMKRVEGGNVAEVVLATSPTTEGEATALYIQKRLKPTGVKISRIAYGLPVGSDLEYADQVTLSRSLTGRREMES